MSNQNFTVMKEDTNKPKEINIEFSVESSDDGKKEKRGFFDSGFNISMLVVSLLLLAAYGFLFDYGLIKYAFYDIMTFLLSLVVLLVRYAIWYEPDSGTPSPWWYSAV